MGLSEKLIPYRHEAPAMTVGDLAAALGVPADIDLAVPRTAPIRVSVLRAPSTNVADGGDVEEGEYVITTAGLAPDWVPPDWSKGEREGHWVEPGTNFVLSTDWPTGDYERTEEVWT